MSGRRLVAGDAVEHLLRLLARHLVPARPGILDNLDLHRRVEVAYPSLAVDLEEAFEKDAVLTARKLLDLAVRELSGRDPDLPIAGAHAVRQFLDSALASS